MDEEEPPDVDEDESPNEDDRGAPDAAALPGEDEPPEEDPNTNEKPSSQSSDAEESGVMKVKFSGSASPIKARITRRLNSPARSIISSETSLKGEENSGEDSAARRASGWRY